MSEQPNMTAGLKLDSLRTLIEAGSAREALVIADGRAWSIVVKVGMSERPLLAQRGHVRRFKAIDTALALLRSIGIGRAQVDFSAWAPSGG